MQLLADLTSSSLSFQVSSRMERTIGICTPGRLWMPAQEMQRNTPKETETHSTVSACIAAKHV